MGVISKDKVIDLNSFNHKIDKLEKELMDLKGEARWVPYEHTDGYSPTFIKKCSNCGWTSSEYKYCPGCGVLW